MNRPVRRLTLAMALITGLWIIGRSATLAQQPSTQPDVNTSELLRPPPPLVDEAAGQPAGDTGDPSTLARVAPSVFEQARSLTIPSARAEALQRLADAAIFSAQLDEARAALIEAGEAALQVPYPIIHDQRLIATTDTFIALAEEQLRAARIEESIFGEDPAPQPAPDRSVLYAKALEDWERAYALAYQIINPTYRAETLYRVVERQSYGSQLMINESAPLGREGQARPEAPAPIRAIAERTIREAAQEAMTIERPVWQNLALASVCANAALSRQFEVGLEIARTIRQPDSRSETLVRLAESQALSGRRDEATRTYSEAAEAAASISSEGVRSVLAGVLIDNLISVGRFEDARACVTLYPDRTQRFIALAAVAESQGRRGLSESAYRWIEVEVDDPTYQAMLKRRVIDGILESVQQNRSSAVGARGR